MVGSSLAAQAAGVIGVRLGGDECVVEAEAAAPAALPRYEAARSSASILLPSLQSFPLPRPFPRPHRLPCGPAAWAPLSLAPWLMSGRYRAAHKATDAKVSAVAGMGLGISTPPPACPRPMPCVGRPLHGGTAAFPVIWQQTSRVSDAIRTEEQELTVFHLRGWTTRTRAGSVQQWW